MSARISPARAPFSETIRQRLDSLMPAGMAPLVLFTTLARDQRLFDRFMGGGLLDKGHLDLRQREIVIDRVTARCGSEYEWGVHVMLFAKPAALDDAQLASLRHGSADDPCWTTADAILLRFCDSLEESCDLSDDIWRDLEAAFTHEAIIELIMLAGFYRTVSCLTNSLRLPLENGAARFPSR